MMDTYTVTRDGRTLATVETEGEAWACLHGLQGQSIAYAVTYGGYDVIYPNGAKLSNTYKKGNNQ